MLSRYCTPTWGNESYPHTCTLNFGFILKWISYMKYIILVDTLLRPPGILLLTLTLLTWTKWRAPASASKWQMGFNSAFKGLSIQDSCIVFGWPHVQLSIFRLAILTYISSSFLLCLQGHGRIIPANKPVLSLFQCMFTYHAILHLVWATKSVIQ